MKKILFILLAITGCVFTSCENQDWEFPDFEYTTVYFAYQTPVRTITFGEDVWDTSLDNQGQCQIMATIGGVYSNDKDRTISIQVDNSIVDDITFADGESTPVTGTKFSIDQMCEAIYRNDQTAREFINDIDKAIDNVSLRVTEIGAYMNRLESAIESTDVQRESLTQSISTLKDADVAKESSDYIKWQILQQSTATLLSTANQQPQIALNLL